MKKTTLTLIPLLLLGVTGCNKNTASSSTPWPSADESVYDVPIPLKDVPIKQIEMLNVPTAEVEIGYIAYAGIQVKITYTDDTTATIPFTERLLDKSSYAKLNSAGKKSIDFVLQGAHASFDITLKTTDRPVYHKVSYYDHYNNLIGQFNCRYLSTAVYNSPRADSYYHGDYYYEFNNKWDVDLDYVFCDIDAHAVYDQKSDRVHGHNYRHTYSIYDEYGQSHDMNALALISDANPDMMELNNYGLFYLGELDNVEFLSGQTIFHEEGHFDKAIGPDKDAAFEIDGAVQDIVNKGYRVGERQESTAHPYYDYLATIKDPLWLKITPEKRYYGKPKGIAYDVNDVFLKPEYTRADGRKVSLRSIIKDDTIASIREDFHPENIQIYTGYPTGYYRVSYVMDIDLSLQTLLIGMYEDYYDPMIMNPQTSELIPGYIGGSVRAVLSYSPSGDFSEIHFSPLRYDIEDLVSYFGLPA